MTIIPFLYILFANATLTIITKKTFGKTLPLTFFITIIILLISGIVFKTFKVGYVVNILFSLYSVVYLIKKKEKRKEFKNNYFSNGFYTFITLFILIWIYDYNRHFSHWDEYSHWGEMVKEMLRIDKLYTVKESVLQAHKDYPPAISLFELMWCKLTGGYSETQLIRSLHTFEFSLFIPAINETKMIKNKKELIINSIIGIVFIYIAISLLDQHGVINSIYTDYIMAILLAYAIFIIIDEKKLLSNNFITTLSITSIIMLLTKQMGLPFYLMILYTYIVKLIYNKEINKKNTKQIIKATLLIILLPIITWKAWDIYVNSMYSLQQFKTSDIKIEKLYGIINGTAGKDYQITAAKNYLNALKTINISKSILQFTFIKAIIFSLILLYLTYIYNKKTIQKRDIINIGSIILLGSIGYAFIMLTLYVFNFGKIEGPNIASYDRYMDTYIIFCISIIYMIFIKSFSSKHQKGKRNYLFILLIISILLIEDNTIENYKINIKSNEKSPYETSAEIIKKYTTDGKVFIIAQDSVGDFQYLVKYYANPITVNLKDFNLRKEKVSENYKERIKNKILKYDYLFLARLDDKFKDNYDYLFENKDDIKEQCLYKIENNKITIKGC